MITNQKSLCFRVPQSSSLPQSREKLWGRDWLSRTPLKVRKWHSKVVNTNFPFNVFHTQESNNFGWDEWNDKRHQQLPRKVEVGCLRNPGASTICSQLLDGDRFHGWQIQATQPWAPMQKEKNRHLPHWQNSGKKGRDRGGETVSKESPRSGKHWLKRQQNCYNTLWTKNTKNPGACAYLTNRWPWR